MSDDLLRERQIRGVLILSSLVGLLNIEAPASFFLTGPTMELIYGAWSVIAAFYAGKLHEEIQEVNG